MSGATVSPDVRSPSHWLATLDRRARLRDSAGLRRTLTHRDADDSLYDLAGNDYLGLATHPEVIEAAAAALRRHGLGATGSRLVRGSTTEHAALERELAEAMRAPAALVYSSGYLANLGALTALATPRSLVVLDEHSHASLIDAGRLSRAETVMAPHNDSAALAAILGGHPGRPSVVVIESVYSVDGDLAPLRELHAVCRRNGALLLVDDAHALGVLGPDGGGAVAAAGLAGEPDVVVTATLSKALGGSGGVVAAAEPVIRHLIETSRPFIFDTAPPPTVVAGVRRALELVRGGDELRATVARRAALATAALRGTGLPVVAPAAGVLSVTAPSPSSATAWASACRERNVAVGCFRPPSVPDGKSRLRLTINAGVAELDFAAALEVVVSTAPSGPDCQGAPPISRELG